MKKYLSFVVVFSFSLNLIARPNRIAKSNRVAPPTPVTQQEPLKITPQTLREKVLDRNLVIMTALNKVYQAKLDINIKRAQLLPSLNLGAALNTQGGGFFLQTVTFLLPFLVPSNWFNLDESKYVFEAEKFSYYLLKLNIYASAFSTIVTIKGDRELQKVLDQQYQTLLRIQEIIQLRYDFGLTTETDLTQAKAQTQLAYVQLSQVQALVDKENSILRSLLALPLEEKFELADFAVASSSFEETDPVPTLEAALKISPEYAQINNLISASKAGKWSKAFAFMNNPSLNVSGTNSHPIAFNDMTAVASFNFGLGYIPALALTEATTQQLEIRKQEIKIEQAQMIESNLAVISKAKLQLDQATQAEAGLNQVLQIQIANYSLGITDLLHILDTQNAVTQASTARVRSQMDLDNLRINMHRIMLTDEFKKIEPCKAKQAKQSVWKEIKDFFYSPGAQKAVEQQCKGTKQK